MALTSKSSYVKPPRQVCLGRRAVGQDFSPSRRRFVVSFDGPHRPPHSFARLGPSPVRGRINSCSNSASPSVTVNIRRPQDPI